MGKLRNHLKNIDVNNRFLEVAYGLTVVAGDLCKSYVDDSNPQNLYVQHKLGKGEWNKCLALWFKGFTVPTADYKFYPGKLSTGNSDPVQGVDSIFDEDIPHSATAWVRAKVPAGAEVDLTSDLQASPPSGLAGIYETLKVEDYNNTGVAQGKTYSANPARQIADLFLEQGQRPSSRIDWGAWRDWRDYLAGTETCDYTTLGVPGFGLTATYFDGLSFNTQVDKRVDAVVEFMDLDTAGASGGKPSIYIASNTSFSARYEGKIQFEYSQTYTFTLTHDGGAKLWVNGTLIIDQWASIGTHTGTFNATANTLKDIKVEWKNDAGDAEIRLEWESTSQAKEVVPSEKLYPKNETVSRYETHPEFVVPTRLDDAIRTILRLCNSWCQQVNGKYRFFCFEQLNTSSFHFKESLNYYPDSIEIEPTDPTVLRNSWTASFQDLDSQYLEVIREPILLEDADLISKNGRIGGQAIDLFATTRWQAYKTLQTRMDNALLAQDKIKLKANANSYPVLAGDRVKADFEFLDEVNKEFLVTESVDKSSEDEADDRTFELREWTG